MTSYIRTMSYKSLILTAIPVILSIASARAQNADSIIAAADKKFRGESSIAEMTMTVQRPTWSREISMKSWTRGQDLAIILITGPPREKGIVYLKRGNEVWNWLPSIEKVIKIPPSMMMQSWMGSDFTNDDLVKESSIVTDYTHKIIGDSTIEGRHCYEIELIPKPEAPVVWGKILAWISEKDLLELRVEYYDEDGNIVNIMVLSDIREMGGRVIPTRLELTPVDEPDHKTIMIYTSIQFNRPIDESFFTEQNMKRLR
jgi:outer membrane lipoprotein-sorting protein